MFYNVSLSWIIQIKEQIYLSSDEKFAHWCKGGIWYNKTIRNNLHVTVFEDLFVTARQDRYQLMCGLHAYKNMHKKSSDEMIFDGGRPIPDDSTIDYLQSLSVRINFIYTCLKNLEPHFAWRCCEYQ